jgi:hypothetical protein
MEKSKIRFLKILFISNRNIEFLFQTQTTKDLCKSSLNEKSQRGEIGNCDKLFFLTLLISRYFLMKA